MAYGDNRNQVATDDFNSGISGDWENGGGDWASFTATSSQISTSSGLSTGLRRSAAGESYDISGTYDQYSITEVGNLGSGSDFYGAAARMQPGTDESAYVVYFEDATPEYAIYEYNSAFGFSRLTGSSHSTTIAVGDKITIECEGSTIRFGCDNPTSDTERTSTTDTTLTDGRPGCVAFRGSTDIRLDNWEGGKIGITASFPYHQTNERSKFIKIAMAR